MSTYTDEPYFKVQRRIFESSIWDEDPVTRIVWFTLLALAQKPEQRKLDPGVVIITPDGLAREANVKPKQLQASIEKLTAPDSRSRTQPSERIEVLPNGYRIINFAL